MTDSPFDGAIASMLQRVNTTADEAGAGFPVYADPATGSWTRADDGFWTGGFWCGLLWLAARANRGDGLSRQGPPLGPAVYGPAPAQTPRCVAFCSGTAQESGPFSPEMGKLVTLRSPARAAWLPPISRAQG